MDSSLVFSSMPHTMQLLDGKEGSEGGLFGMPDRPHSHGKEGSPILRDGKLLSLGTATDMHVRSQSISGEASGSRFSPQQDQNGNLFQPPSLPISLSTTTNFFHSQHQHAPLELQEDSPSQSIPSRLKGTAQLTIFYNGAINVYNNVPAEKARAIMLLAGSGNSMEYPQISKIPLNTMSQPASKVMASHHIPICFSAPKLDIASATAFSVSTQVKQQQPQRRSYASDLPYSRKASLARFLHQRTERVQAKICRKETEDRLKEREERWLEFKSPKRQCIGIHIPEVSS